MVTVVAICCVDPAGAENTISRGMYIDTLRASAEKGNAEAQYELGNNYLVGAGVQKDRAAAAKWYQHAADQNHAKAQSALGMMYSLGAGVPKDNNVALKWWVMAAEQHDADAQDQIGFAYLLGDGVPKNHVQAYMWFNLAAMNGDKHAVKDRESVSKFMIEEQLQEAKKLSDEWMEKHPKALASTETLVKRM